MLTAVAHLTTCIGALIFDGSSAVIFPAFHKVPIGDPPSFTIAITSQQVTRCTVDFSKFIITRIIVNFQLAFIDSRVENWVLTLFIFISKASFYWSLQRVNFKIDDLNVILRV